MRSHPNKWAIPAVMAGVLALSTSVFVTPAQAGIDFVEVQTTTIPLPQGANPGTWLSISQDGAVYLATSTRDAAQLIDVELGSGGTAISYTFDENPVMPIATTFGPEGDLIVRGNASVDNTSLVGVTARLSAEDGSVVWEQSDANLSMSDEYVGIYEQAAGPVVWSETRQRVLIFTAANFEIAPVSQASALFDFNGDVRKPSVLFGTEYIGATLNNALRRPDGKFLVYYFSQNDKGARFFIYDGLESIDAWRPEGGDWTKREIFTIQYDPNENLILLWNDLESPNQGGYLTKLDPDGKLLWEQDLSGAIEVTNDMGMTGNADLLRPAFMVSAADEVVLLRQVGTGFYFDVRSSDDGSPLGFFDFAAITDKSVTDLDFLVGSNRNYLLPTVDPEDPTKVELLQVELVLNDDPVVIDEPANSGNSDANAAENGDPFNNAMGNNAGGEDDEEDEGPNVERPGCGCSTPTRSAPWGGALGLAALGAISIFIRRRRQ